MKIKIESLYMWDGLSDKDRLKLILELIHTAPNSQGFLEQVKKKIEKLEMD